MRDVNLLDLVETIREGILVLEPDLTIRFANRSFYDTFAVASEQTVGRKVYEIGNGQWDIPQLRTWLETTISGRKTIEAFEVEHFSPSMADAQGRTARTGVYRPDSKTRQILTGWLQCQPDNRSMR
jgi:PAS domain-containing protein